jgi:hypothetical protein
VVNPPVAGDMMETTRTTQQVDQAVEDDTATGDLGSEGGSGAPVVQEHRSAVNSADPVSPHVSQSASAWLFWMLALIIGALALWLLVSFKA